jgi:hypothetical protein
MADIKHFRGKQRNLAKPVIASAAKQSRAADKDWIALSLTLLAMTVGWQFWSTWE